MRLFALVTGLAPLLLAGTLAAAQSATVGDDLYTAGAAAAHIPRVERDLFAAGPKVRATEGVGQDAHVAGYSVQVGAETGGDLYAVGGDLRIAAPVGGDLSAMGFSVTLEDTATVGGNARVSGGSVTLNGGVAGALVASGGSVALDAVVAGDAWIAAGSLDFGPDARIGGTLHIASSEPVDVPGRVAAPDRVVVEAIETREMPRGMDDWRDGWSHGMRPEWRLPGPFAVSAAAVVTVAFLLALGAVFLAAAPARVEALRARAARRPWLVLLLGIAGLSALVGLIPVSAATLIGIPLVPIAILGAILLWTLGYLLGAYTVALALFENLGARGGRSYGTGARIAALALGLVTAAVLNFVPFLGWMTNLVLGFLGIGAMVLAAAQRVAPPAPGQARPG